MVNSQKSVFSSFAELQTQILITCLVLPALGLSSKSTSLSQREVSTRPMPHGQPAETPLASLPGKSLSDCFLT